MNNMAQKVNNSLLLLRSIVRKCVLYYRNISKSVYYANKYILLTLLLIMCSCVDIKDTEIEYVNIYLESDPRFSIIGGASWVYQTNPFSPIEYKATVTNMGTDTLRDMTVLLRGYIWDADSLVIADCTAIVIQDYSWSPKQSAQWIWQSMYEYSTMSNFEYWGMSVAVQK